MHVQRAVWARTRTRWALARASRVLSPLGSSKATDCQCNIGYTGPNANTCSACGLGIYKKTLGSGACSACPASSTSAQASTSSNNCVCIAGYTGLSGGTCAACSIGTYESTLGSASCTMCPQSSSSLSAGTGSQLDCLCNAGYTGPNGGACSVCATGTYKRTPGSTPCSFCLDSNSSPVLMCLFVQLGIHRAQRWYLFRMRCW